MLVSKRSPLVLPLALATVMGGWTLPAVAQDDAAAAPATDGGSDSVKLVQSAQLYVHNVMIAKPEAANAAANALLADSVEPSVLAMAIDGADLGKRMDDAFRRSRRMAEVSDASAALETKLESGRQILARKIERDVRQPAHHGAVDRDTAQRARLRRRCRRCRCCRCRVAD